MPITNAERQMRYRRKKLDSGERVRLDMFVTATTAAGLARLAERHGVSRAAMLARLVTDAERAADVAAREVDLLRSDIKR